MQGGDVGKGGCRSGKRKGREGSVRNGGREVWGREGGRCGEWK